VPGAEAAKEEFMSVTPRDIVRNNVKEKLARGEVVASMTVRLVRSIEIARLAKTAGFDTLYVDVEHSSLSYETTSQICIAALDIGIAPFVRVPSTHPEHVSRALDGGALGVITPHVRSAAEAREVVAAAKFPPLGERSAAGPLPHFQYRPFPAAEANAAMNEASMVVVQFETANAVEHAEEIAAVEGLDMVLIGTNDLLAEMGLPGQYEHKRVREAYERTIAACRKHGKHVGVGGLATRPTLAAEFVKMGARYVSTGTDLAFLLAESTVRARQVHGMALP
jgi:2-keto-3-deoxy-L-rhamnonate aldolase RhmA